TNLLERMTGTEETPHGVYFQCGKTSHLGKKTILVLTADSMLYKLDKQNTKEKKNVELCQDKILLGFCDVDAEEIKGNSEFSALEFQTSFRFVVLERGVPERESERAFSDLRKYCIQMLSVQPDTKPKGCAGCNRKIKDRYLLKALDKYWHEDCLKCACCDCRLGEVGSTLYTKANLILCRRDYLRKDALLLEITQ
ncbi:hypothetical protein STEG23_001611, partial [Scotinomys teguina]